MADGFLAFVRVILPTLVLLVAPAASRPSYGLYREVFSSQGAYLDVYFQLNPRGRFQDPENGYPVKFEGFWVTAQGAEKVYGTYQRRTGRGHYSFRIEDSIFTGLVNETKSCAEMRFAITGRQPASEGTLASCPSKN